MITNSSNTMTVNEAAQHVGKTPHVIRQWIRRGKLRAFKDSYKGRFYIAPEALEEAINKPHPLKGRIGPNALEIIRLVQEGNPMTLQEIGDKVGVSRERVRQILNEQGIKNQRVRHRRVRHRPKYADNPCRNCGSTSRGREGSLCNQCRRFLNIRYATCETCGILFHRHGGNDPMRFCSKQCLGVMVGKNYGFTAHPENAVHGKQKQSHCKRGHAFEGDNLYVSPKGERHCRTCQAIRDRRRYDNRNKLERKL